MQSRQRIGFVVTFLTCVCFIATYSMSQEKSGGGYGGAPDKKDKPAGGGAPPGMDPDMMNKMMEAAKPGPQHKALEPMAGKFAYTTKWKMDPSMDWTTSTGDYEGEMIMDGRYLTYTVKGPMMGSNFVGMGCLGYDNTLKKYVAGWIDNMGTGLMRSEGTSSDGGKTITFEGEMMDPMMGKMTKYKYVYEIKPDAWTMRWWSPSPADGKMFESMVIESTRVKG
jgi:hypothetical protein